jgi:hypothetical protein
VAERVRLTNKERRAQAREERRRKEAEAAKKKQRGQLRNGLITLAIVVVVAAVIIQAFVGGPTTIDDPILISTSEAEAAREAAGCEVLTQQQPLPDASHMDTAPGDLSGLYSDVRPTHSGPHTPTLHPVGTFGRQIDEFNSTHNLEHGAVIVWWDPDQAGDASGDIEDWAETLNASGFSDSQLARFGVGIITSRYDDPGLSSGKAIAFRAWGTAMDCDEWDETAANSFVIENYGTHGIAPERGPAVYPRDVLFYEDVDVEDTPEDEAPIEGEPDDPDDPDETEDDAADDQG